MEMTIDEAIEIINHYLDYPKEEVRKALLLAIQTMRKYKKIEQIIEDWTKTEVIEWKIREVIEDGKGEQNT